jgi:uncharacterized protein (DUF2147 family)
MKMLLAMAALLLASSAVQAQYQFDYGGRTITIDPNRGTVSIPGVYDNTGRKSKRRERSPSQDAKTDSQPPPAPSPAPVDAAAPPTPPAPPPATAATPPEPPAATANNAPADTAVPPPAPQPQLPPPQQSAAPPQPPPAPPAPTVAAVPPPPPPPAPRSDPNSPIGIWLTEEKEGKVRIVACGANLCGYSVDAKTNANGEQVLVNMHPSGQKWAGRIIDPNTGSTYDSTIALKGSDTLRVQGCAFGGMFCGGQTWTRVN